MKDCINYHRVIHIYHYETNSKIGQKNCIQFSYEGETIRGMGREEDLHSTRQNQGMLSWPMVSRRRTRSQDHPKIDRYLPV